MRILFLTQWFEPEPVFKGVAFAKSLAERGHHVEVVTGFPNYPTGQLFAGYKMSPYQRELLEGITIHRVALYPSHDNSSVRRILNYLSFSLSAAIYLLMNARRFDVIYAYPQVTVGLAACFSGMFTRKPVVLDIQDLWPDSVLKSGMSGTRFMKPVLDLICSFVHRRSSRIVSQSEGIRDCLIERGVPASKIAVIRNWADEDAAKVSGTCDLGSYHFEGRFNIVFGGNFGRVQGLDTLIRAAHECRDRLPKLQLLLIGNGVEVQSLHALVADLRADNVRIAPGVPRQMIGDVFGAADALILHLHKDPLFEITIPSKTQFYLAMGKPILIGVNGEAARLVEEAGAGIAFQPENVQAASEAMIAMAKMAPTQRQEMGLNGQKAYWRDLSFASALAETENVLERAIASDAR